MELVHGQGRSFKQRGLRVYIVFLDVLGVKPTEYVRMMKAYENLGKTPLGVLLNRRTLAWATRLLAIEDPPPPKKKFNGFYAGQEEGTTGRPHAL